MSDLDVLSERLSNWFTALNDNVNRLITRVEVQNGRVAALERQITIHLAESEAKKIYARVDSVEQQLEALIGTKEIGDAIVKDRAKLVTALVSGAGLATPIILFKPWEWIL